MSTLGRLIALEGPSGVGKSTTALRVAPHLGWYPLAEAFARLRPPPSLAFRTGPGLVTLEERLLAEEGRRYGEAIGRSRRGQRVLADTGFLGPLTYAAGLVAGGWTQPAVLDRVRRTFDRRWAEGKIGWPDAVLYLDLPGPALALRAARDTEGHPKALALRHRSVARFERAFYLHDLERCWPGRVIRIPAAGSPLAVARRVEAALGHLPRPGAGEVPDSRPFDRLVRRAEAAAARRSRSAAILKKGTRSHGAPRR